MDAYPSAGQRAALLTFAEALGCRGAALRRDECGDWRIVGRLGNIYAVPEGFQIYFRGAEEFGEPTSSQGWTWAKRAMAFASVVNDGDAEGTLVLDRLPTEAEAAAIRDKLMIPKKREIGEAERERLRAMGFPATHVAGDCSAQESPLLAEPVSSYPER